ncbi:10468_t:CDS:2 [Funneliformis geosporum]|uniref:10468_t:CDS:1 n=1 Tax=Funneliformis geosporum TaxID=1117311 RepID=A0A9W4SMS3_9GLOM|nr:10468_t:CDS:2 [Funneliformis geosporum]
MSISSINFPKWLEKHSDKLRPPINNFILQHNDDFIIMVVGGLILELIIILTRQKFCIQLKSIIQKYAANEELRKCKSCELINLAK